MVVAWSEVLQEIPSSRLNDCYLIAMRQHSTSFPLSAGEIASVWYEKAEGWAKEADMVQREAVNVDRGHECTFGYILVDGKGAKPCPVCNPQQAARW